MSNSTNGIPAVSKNFPVSTASPSRIFRFAGVTPEATDVVREALTENDHKYDIWERIRFFHNHFAHSILTRYALGASPELLRDAWKHDAADLISLDPSDSERQKSKPPPDPMRIPDEITRDNWDDPTFLEYDGSYAQYLAFFHREIDRLGPIETLKEYVFSPTANWEGRKAMMLARIHGGVLHPMIHIGFGLEFQDRIVLAEGLSMACVHKVDLFGSLFDLPFPQDVYSSLPSTSGGAANGNIASDHLGSWTPIAHNGEQRKPRKGKSLLEIYADLCADPKAAPVPNDDNMLIGARIKNATADGRADIMKKLIGEWVLEPEDLEGEGLERKMEEVAVLATLLACATGREGKEDRIDFFLMHALTSSIFIPSYMPFLEPAQRKALLHTYLLVCFTTAISRGRPHLNPGLLMSHCGHASGPGTRPSGSGGKNTLSDASKEESQNAWLGIVQSSLFANDSHVSKSIRSLVHHSSLYGHLHAGSVIGAFRSDTGKPTLPGSEKLDGSMFLRGAGMVMDATGWVREGEKEGHWDRSALGYDDVWS